MVTRRAVQLGVGLQDKGASDSCTVQAAARPWAVAFAEPSPTREQRVASSLQAAWCECV